MSLTPPASELTAHLGFWLRAVSNRVSHAFAGKLAAKGVTVAEWVTLRALYGKDPLPPSRLASQMGMTRGAITKLADRLIARGLVLRSAEDRDGRAQRLALTDAGRALVPRLAALADLNEAAAFGHLPPPERAAFEATLLGLIRHHGLKTAPTD